MSTAFDDLYTDEDYVCPEQGCSLCGETAIATLIWTDPGDGPYPALQRESVYCASCQIPYNPDTGHLLD